MYPDAQQHQPAGPASLPPVAIQSEAVPSAPAPLPSMPSGGNPAATVEQVVMQAKLLTKQYAQDPFRLSGAVEQLKSSYLAEQHHIATKPVEN